MLIVVSGTSHFYKKRIELIIDFLHDVNKNKDLALMNGEVIFGVK